MRNTLAILAALCLALTLSACATTASPATIQTACNVVAALDADFQNYAKLVPGKIDSNGMNTEGTAMFDLGLTPAAGIPAKPAPGSLCDPTVTQNAAQATIEIANATLTLSTLLATWQK